MPTTLLYYPTIDVPTSGPWIRQTLLYWDQIASIVPDSYDGSLPDQSGYSLDIQCLHEEGIFRPVNPAQLFDGTVADRFAAEILSITSSRRFVRAISGSNREWVSIPIYQDKVAHSLFERLKSKGLAARHPMAPGGDKFYFFEPRVFAIYMAMMAEYLAKLDGPLTMPGTDKLGFLRGTMASSPQGERSFMLSAYFRELLPTPAPDVSIREILSFRQKYQAELTAFRVEIEKTREALNGCSSLEEIAACLKKQKLKVEAEAARLHKALKKFGIETFLGSVQAFFKPPIPAVVGGAAIAAGYAAAGSPLPATTVLATGGAFGLLEVSTHLVRRSRDKDALVEKSPLSYLVLANRKFARPCLTKPFGA